MELVDRWLEENKFIYVDREGLYWVEKDYEIVGGPYSTLAAAQKKGALL